MMNKSNKRADNENKTPEEAKEIILDKKHLGSSQAFEETENPLSRDADNISDEKLDDLLGDG
jgi:hypothetical protein